MKVAVTGATGFIGRGLVAALQKRGADVRVLARDPSKAGKALPGTEAFAWDAEAGPPPAAALAGADSVVHLAGEGIADRRWSEARKKRLYDSRVTGTRNLVTALASAEPRPRTLVTGSAIGFYGSEAGKPVDESAASGSDFLAKLCVDWENAARPAEKLGVRVVFLRSGVVLGKGGGALAKMITPFKLGVGGRIGDGKQPMSWIHLDDEVGLILHALDRGDLKGPLNAVAPGAVSNAEFAKALGRAMHRPAFFPVPAFALEAMLGRQLAREVLLSGAHVLPAVAEKSGYKFRHTLESALQSSV